MALAAEQASLIGQVAFETPAAMSRLPPGQRLAPAVVLEWLERRFTLGWLTLPATATHEVLRESVERGIRGGALYDALIAATAKRHAHTLLSADRRAAPVYQALGADVVYISGE